MKPSAAGDPGSGGADPDSADGGTATSAMGFEPPAGGELRISELLINPAGTDTGREWIEIQNVSGRPLDVSLIHVADRLNDAAVDWGSAAPELEVGACAVLLQSSDPTKNGGVAAIAGGASAAAVPLLGSFGTRVSLNNDTDMISVCVGACASGTGVDSVRWDGPLGPDYDGHAVSRDERGRTCPATQPFGDAGSFGSPGTANPLCP